MAINATNEGKKFEPIEAGNYVARCYSMIHIGTIEETIQGKKKHLNKVRIAWELPTEMKVYKEENGEQPAVISKEFTLSMNEKSTLRAFLKNWRGKDFSDDEAKSFDITVLLGLPCMLNITHKPKADGSAIYAEIGNVSAMPKGMVCPPQINDIFELNYDDFDTAVFATLPEYIRKKMEASLEYQAILSNDISQLASELEQDDNEFFGK